MSALVRIRATLIAEGAEPRSACCLRLCQKCNLNQKQKTGTAVNKILSQYNQFATLLRRMVLILRRYGTCLSARTAEVEKRLAIVLLPRLAR